MTLFEQLKILFDNGLYTNVTYLANMLLSVSDNNPDFLSYTTKYQTLVIYGDALAYLKEYRKAEHTYKRALQLRKSLAKAKGKAPFPAGEVTSEVDVKYRTHVCLVRLKLFNQAIHLLEGIPPRQRTSQVNMELGKLYQQNGADKDAIAAYREVLRECPFAVEAAKCLLSLGVKSTEVQAMMQAGNVSAANIEWFSIWIKAHAHLYGREHSLAITTFKQLDSKTSLRDNTDVLISLGHSFYFNGDFTNAISVMDRAHCLDPLLVKGMDVYAALLAKEKKIKELENLTGRLISVNDCAPEPWIAMGYFCYVIKKGARAIHFAQKACVLNPRHIEALLLKGTILLDLKKAQDAITHFGEAYKIAPFRYEAHKGLVDCYLALHRTREAVAIASSACKQLGQSARALTLYASVMTKDPISAEKAKPLLEKALKQDPTYLNAVYLLATIYEQERLYEKGIELLKKHMEQQSSCRLHQMLGDFLSRTNDHEKALHHFSLALNMDPSDQKASEGSQRVEQNPDTSESFEVDDIADSENDAAADFVAFNEADVEESEVEAVWSDVDYT